MTQPPMPPPPAGEAAASRRRYDSPLRREQAAQTRERIVVAGAALARRLPTWQWDQLTFRAVAERAEVGLRTVYRYFPTERQLHEAIMRRLEEEAGIAYESVTRANVTEVMARVFRAMPAFAARDTIQPAVDPTLEAASERRRDALRRVLAEAAPEWPEARREPVAALLDVLWSAPAFEQLVRTWDLGGEEATDALAWVMTLVLGAVAAGEAPAARTAADRTAAGRRRSEPRARRR